MSSILFDTNVLLDIATADANWFDWSEGQFRTAAALGPILINPIIYAELAPAFATQHDLDGWLDPAIFQRHPLPYAAGWLAAHGGTLEVAPAVCAPIRGMLAALAQSLGDAAPQVQELSCAAQGHSECHFRAVSKGGAP